MYQMGRLCKNEEEAPHPVWDMLFLGGRKKQLRTTLGGFLLEAEIFRRVARQADGAGGSSKAGRTRNRHSVQMGWAAHGAGSS